MAEEKQQKSIFQGVMDAIGSGKRRTPPMQSTSQFSPSTKTSDLVKGGSGGVAAVENVQQQFLDWQVNKISHNLYTRQIYFDTDRLSAYQDFRAMDMSPEIAAALNIMRDECLSKGDRGEILGIYSENERVKSVLKDLFTNRLNVEYNMKLWIRELMKYGDYFVLLKVDKEDGIYSFLTLPPEEIHREDGYNGNPEDVRFRWDTMGMYFDDWQVAHFRIIEDSKRLPFGRSILDPARKLWKQLQLAEDSMLVYRMCLAGDTRVRTDHGYKYIKDICEGDRVISYNKNGQPEYSNVVYHVNNGKKKLLRIRSKHNEIVCTETHPILVNTGGVVHYVDAKDIVVGKDKVINASTRNLEIKEKKIERIYDEKFAKLNIDYIKIFKNKKEINKSLIFREIEKEINYPSDRVKQFAYLEKKAIPYDVAISFCDKVGFDSNVCLEVINKGENNSSRINLPEYINEELARLLGFIIGDGYIRKHGFGFATGVDNEVNEYYRKLIEKYFGKVVFQIDKRSKIGTGKYCVSSKTAADILRNLGINDLHKTIRIPEWVFNLPYNKRKEFVLGISDADGCERRTNKGTWFSTIELSNKKLVEDIKELWHSIGFASGHLKSRFKKGGHCIDGRRIPSSISYSVTISEIELPIYENVILVEDAGEDFVYDISVDNDLHNFIANGIPVHNTRAPERRVFYIEVGNLADQDVQTYMMKIQNQLKKQPVVDTRNGQYNLKYDPMNITEDFFIPIRGDKASKIDTLPGACLALDTKIDLLDGRSLELGEIIKEYESGNELWAYSINPESGEIVPGEISWAGITRRNTDVVRITLDNGETIVTTPDHKFPTRFNGVKEAKDLCEGESLWSFNKKFKHIKGAGKKREKNTYEMVYDHHLNDWVYTHRMVANYFRNIGEHEEYTYCEDLLNESKDTIHHKNINRYDNSRNNLCFMNSKDHFYYHHDNMKNLEEIFGTDKIEEWKDIRREGIKDYWENITDEEIERRAVTNRKNIKKATEKHNELLREDEEYKRAFYEKTSKTLKVLKNTEENKKRQSQYSVEYWKDEEFRKAVIEKQTIKYSDFMLQFVAEKFREGLNGKKIVKEINKPDSEFIIEFNRLNSGNLQLCKMKKGFTGSNLRKMMRHFGYENWRDFKNKIELFNHKVISVEFLSEKIDVGTITIDKPERYHNFHNFALSCGVFTKNSNMSDIADVNYLQDKLFASLQVPKAYLNYAENLPGGSTLSQADLRFARTINSIQEVVLQELRRIANIHLYFMGLKDEVDNFTLTLTNPSTQQELLKLETMKARMEVFKEMFTAEATSPVSYTWAMENILGFSKAEIKLILKQKKIEKRLFAEIDSSVETYKKIGLFRELDAKYELPGAQTSPAAADETEAAAGGGGGGGGAGELGNLDLGSQLGGMEAGGGATPEAGGAPEGGAAPEATPEAPLAESRKKVIKETFKQSDEISESLVEDLLGKDIGIKKTIQERNESENALQKNNVKINFKLKSLMDNIEKSLDPDRKRQNEQGEQLLREERSKNTLFERSSDIISKTNDTLSQIESLISGEIDDVEISESSGASEEFIVESQEGISNWDDEAQPDSNSDQDNNQVE